MTVINFLVIGAQKSGTSWLLEALKSHRDIGIYSSEIHFFNRNENYLKGINWYKSHFDNFRDRAFIGEKTPDYFQLPSGGIDVAKRIRNDLGEIKLILIMRDPRQRAVSAIKHQFRMGRISPLLSLDNVIQNRPEIIKKFKIFDYSRYEEIIEYFYKHFPKKNIKILFYEDIKARPDFVLEELASFLEIKFDFNISNKDKVNSFNKSKIYLYVNYFFPWARYFALKLDRFFKPANFILSETSKDILNTEFKSTLDYFNTRFQTPKEWK